MHRIHTVSPYLTDSFQHFHKLSCHRHHILGRLHCLQLLDAKNENEKARPAANEWLSWACILGPQPGLRTGCVTIPALPRHGTSGDRELHRDSCKQLGMGLISMPGSDDVKADTGDSQLMGCDVIYTLCQVLSTFRDKPGNDFCFFFQHPCAPAHFRTIEHVACLTLHS